MSSISKEKQQGEADTLYEGFCKVRCKLDIECIKFM